METKANPMEMVERCGAKTRAGHPCKRYAMANGRCRLHGGLSTGRPVTTGQWTNQARRQKKKINQMVRKLNDLISEVEKS